MPSTPRQRQRCLYAWYLYYVVGANTYQVAKALKTRPHIAVDLVSLGQGVIGGAYRQEVITSNKLESDAKKIYRYVDRDDLLAAICSV